VRTQGWTIVVCCVLAGCSTVDNISASWPETDAKIRLAPDARVWTNAWEADRYLCESSTGVTYGLVCDGDSRWALRCACKAWVE